jgi:hypothetical protein
VKKRYGPARNIDSDLEDTMGERALLEGCALGTLLAFGLAGGPAQAQQRLGLSGGFMPDPMSMQLTATGSVAAGDWVRGCPGWVSEVPPLTISLTNPVDPLRFSLLGDGFESLVVAGPDGIYRCAPVDDAGRALVRVDPMLSGDYAIWPGLVGSGDSALAEIQISELDPDFGASGGTGGQLTADATPAFGSHTLPEDGYFEVAITLSGSASAYDVAGGECTGQIDPSRPDIVLSLGGAEVSLAIGVVSDADTTLVVRAPDGQVYCNDDTYGFDPEVSLTNAMAGDWAVWAGVYSGSGGESAVIEVSRTTGGGGQTLAGGDDLVPDAEPAAGVHALLPDGSTEIPITLSAGRSAYEFSDGCYGNIDPGRPDAVIRLEADEPALHLRARSFEDTTLIVVAPDGSVQCNDDTYGLDPALAISPASAGDYAVWVGVYSDQAGESATLLAGRTADASAGDDFGGGMENPFDGRELQSATQALQILLEEQGLSDVVSYEGLEEEGPEGFILTGVVLTDPTGETEPLRIGRIRIADIDLEGLSATGQPSRFTIELDDVDYSSLVEAGEAMAMPSLPILAGEPALSFAASLLPPDGAADRRDLDMSMRLDGQFSLGVQARVGWPEGSAEMMDFESAPAESIGIEFENMGFLGALLQVQAQEMGTTPGELVAQAIAGLNEMLSPAEPGSPQARLLQVATEALNAYDRPGVFRLRLSTDEPQGVNALLEELKEDAVTSDRLAVDVSFETLP